ncbi:FMN-binding negative transcriptional regulator [Nonomuraea sp. NPDC002799]
MFVPGQYREPDSSWAVELVRSNPLALLVANGDRNGVPYATSVPVIVDPLAAEPVDDLTSVTLLGHMNRANPQWPALADGMPVLAIFSGPNAYVSPTVYDIHPAAPTWNFTSVHVHGTVHKIESAEETLAVVMATVRAFEGRFGAGWDMSGSIPYFQQILPGVGAYRIKVSGVDSMFKLSQEQRPEVRDRVRCSFAGSDFGRRREVAGLMELLPEVSAAGSCPVP